MLNSYKLETLEGQLLEGEYHARRLRGFTPREGTELAIQQEEFEARKTQMEKNPETEFEGDIQAEVLEEASNGESTQLRTMED